MEKIAEKKSILGTYIFYKGFDKDIILNHVEKVKNDDNKTMMIVLATAREFLDNLPDEKIECNYLAMYEVYSNHDEWVEQWWEQTRPTEFFYPEWSATRGLLNMKEDIFKISSDDAGIIKLSEHTGDFMFQFDDDEPKQVASIYDYGKVVLELKQGEKILKASDDNTITLGSDMQTNCITFISEDGKKTFKLFIKDKI